LNLDDEPNIHAMTPQGSNTTPNQPRVSLRQSISFNHTSSYFANSPQPPMLGGFELSPINMFPTHLAMSHEGGYLNHQYGSSQGTQLQTPSSTANAAVHSMANMFDTPLGLRLGTSTPRPNIGMPHDQKQNTNEDTSNSPPQMDEKRAALVMRLRYWRHEAMQKYMYESAAFWGDKVVTITQDPNDVFWLAQVYFLMGEYPRTEQLMLDYRMTYMNAACRFLVAQARVSVCGIGCRTATIDRTMLYGISDKDEALEQGTRSAWRTRSIY
jgi:hypothetical protein